MSKKPQMQKRGVPLIERMVRLSAALTTQEKIFLAKHLAQSVGDPLYTQSEMESKLQEIEAAVAHRQRLAMQTEQHMNEYNRLLADPLLRGIR